MIGDEKHEQRKILLQFFQVPHKKPKTGSAEESEMDEYASSLQESAAEEGRHCSAANAAVKNSYHPR